MQAAQFVRKTGVVAERVEAAIGARNTDATRRAIEAMERQTELATTAIEENGLLKARVSWLEAENARVTAELCAAHEVIQTLKEDKEHERSVLFAAKISDIRAAVASEFGVNESEMVSARRTKNLSVPRFAMMFLCRYLTRHSYPTIGRHIGGRDHSTILNGIGQARARMASDEEFKRRVGAVCARLGVPDDVTAVILTPANSSAGEGAKNA